MSHSKMQAHGLGTTFYVIPRKAYKNIIKTLLDESSDLLLPEMLESHKAALSAAGGSDNLSGGDNLLPGDAGVPLDTSSKADAIDQPNGQEGADDNESIISDSASSTKPPTGAKLPTCKIKSCKAKKLCTLCALAHTVATLKPAPPKVDKPKAIPAVGPMVISDEPVVVKKHKRIKKNYRVPIMQEIVAECKVKFYAATDTVANRRAIHRFGSKFCEQHGMRTQHIRTIMPTVVELVLTPDKWELEARDIAATREVKTRRGSQLSWWHSFLNFIEGVDIRTLEIED